MADQKQRLRKAMRQCRDALPREQAAALSRSIQTRALGLQCYGSAAAILLYAAVANEVATDLILADALAAGRCVFYPVIDRDAGRLDFYAVRSREDLHEGQFGIPQPCAGQRFAPGGGDAAVIFVPGLAFSASGQRLGRGGGYYDRFLASTGPGVTAVGLGYSFQVMERLPQEPWDQRLAYVVTERAVLEAGRPGQWRA
jgi:5-formyltetrahydrofolate cyclo-ligase